MVGPQVGDGRVGAGLGVAVAMERDGGGSGGGGQRVEDAMALAVEEQVGGGFDEGVSGFVVARAGVGGEDRLGVGAEAAA